VFSRVLGTIREHGLLEEGDRVLVAVSGGPDSTALLHALVKLAPRLQITLAAASVDHGLRPESAGEAREVRRRCQRIGVGCEVVEVDLGKARRPHVSIQEAARDARLAALEETAGRLGCNKIALGHIADDQAETVLFRILRGTGIAGLAGIPYQRGLFVRPLLDVRRAQILAFLTRRKIDFLSDPSNANRRYARSRIRHDVLPALARENPRVVEALLALAREARGKPSRPWHKSLPEGLYLPRRAVEVVDRLVRKGEGTRTVAVKSGSLVVRYGKVAWVPFAPGSPVAMGSSRPRARTIAGPGEYRVSESPAPALEITPVSTSQWPRGNAACFDPAKVGWPLVLRTLRPGDRMSPRAGRGTRRLSDLIIDAKIPREARAALPVLCDRGGTILFVPGLRPSEAGRPDEETREWFEVRVAR
jgi:tRNA(Ile)-lysidine synthase